MIVKCWHCGSEITALSEVRDVYQLGLALMGSCPHCGAVIGVNSLWRKRYEQKFAQVVKTHRVDAVIKAGRAGRAAQARDAPGTARDAKKRQKSGHSA